MRRSRGEKRHIENLANLLGIKLDSAEVLLPQLEHIERIGHKLAEAYCNGEIDSEYYYSKMSIIKDQIAARIPHKIAREVLLNGDPRGYFLKLNDEYVRKNKIAIETDWGGYGILAPNFY